jgi:rhomboid protease GluP
MGSGLLAVVYLAVIGTALASARPVLPGRTGPARATLAALVLVTVPSLLQLTVAPELQGRLGRDAAAIAEGELWRLMTALVVQDGGWAGTVSNLALLLVVGLVAERMWGAGRWVAVALVSAVGGELWGLVVQPVGAGNSVLVFGLAASLAGAVLASGAAAPRSARALAVTSLVVAAVLLVIGDLHGGAAALGAVVGAVLVRRAPRSAHRPLEPI